jgi:hypothetical protein
VKEGRRLRSEETGVLRRKGRRRMKYAPRFPWRPQRAGSPPRPVRARPAPPPKERVGHVIAGRQRPNGHRTGTWIRSMRRGTEADGQAGPRDNSGEEQDKRNASARGAPTTVRRPLVRSHPPPSRHRGARI